MRDRNSDSCPYFEGFDPLDPDFARDPMQVYDNLPAPVFYAPSIDHFVVTSYKDIETICLNHSLFSSSTAQVPVVPLSAHAEMLLEEDGRAPKQSLLSLDPPQHSRLRAPLAKTFSPRRVAALEEVIRSLARNLLDPLKSRTRFDLMVEYASPLPATVIFNLLGVPESDWSQLLAWSDHRSRLIWGRPSLDEQLIHASNVVDYRVYLREFIASKTPDADGDLTQALLAFGGGVQELSPDDVLSILYSLTFAGHQTTTFLIGNAVNRLLLIPAGLEAIRSESGLVDLVIDEVIRLDPPVITLQRVAKRRTTVGEVQIPEGAKLLLWLTAAGLDPSAYAKPPESAPGRSSPTRSLAFGRGVHFCIGAALGRMEARVALEELAGAFPSLIKDPTEPTVYEPNLSFRGPRNLVLVPSW